MGHKGDTTDVEMYFLIIYTGMYHVYHAKTENMLLETNQSNVVQGETPVVSEQSRNPDT